MLTLTIDHRNGDRRWSERSLEASLEGAMAQGRYVLDTDATARSFRIDETWPAEYSSETITRYRETTWRKAIATNSPELGRSTSTSM